MRIPKIYLETTIFNFPFVEDAPDKRRDVLRLFEEIANGKYLPFISVYVVSELEKADEPLCQAMIHLIKKYIVSYNFQHIVKRKTIIMTGIINKREGYKQIEIYSPTEVIENVD